MRFRSQKRALFGPFLGAKKWRVLGFKRKSLKSDFRISTLENPSDFRRDLASFGIFENFSEEKFSKIRNDCLWNFRNFFENFRNSKIFEKANFRQNGENLLALASFRFRENSLKMRIFASKIFCETVVKILCQKFLPPSSTKFCARFWNVQRRFWWGRQNVLCCG